jgi:hypothetical protein
VALTPPNPHISFNFARMLREETRPAQDQG